MDERIRRVGLNEAVFREINEQVESLNRSLADISDNQMHIVCECGQLECVERLVVPLLKYEEIRSDSALFFIRPGHAMPDAEDVVEQADGYDVVRKHAGEAEQLAAETDPRS
ncbi:MAG: hypothetical protein QOF43_338 [Gaiellaceae bacterium]|jgi:hypothetical protein|nr:hypothetical protein [Gaiellaceae bacterium]